MPRKTNKTEKPSLRFTERPRGGAKLQHHGPEVRAALNPKDYFAETQASSTFTSWVSPQFDTSIPVAPKGRRGRKCLSVTSILGDASTHLTRKKTVCKYSSLSFESSERKQSHLTKRKKKNGKESDAPAKPVESSCVQGALKDNLKRPSDSSRKGQSSSAAASTASQLDESPSVTKPSTVQDPSTPTYNQTSANDPSTIGPGPDLDTPKSTTVSSPRWSLIQPSASPCRQPPDILVANTPERQYGMKVTWRRREDFMIFLKKKGHLSDSDVQSNN